jgi:hypothetical protein
MNRRSIVSLIGVLLLLTVACEKKVEAPATRTTFVISGPEKPDNVPIAVRSFEVVPESIRAGESATVRIELEAARPSQRISVDWYGPDGWLVAYEIRDATEARMSVPAPVNEFDEAGRYRGVLRSGTTTLAEDSVTVRASH